MDPGIDDCLPTSATTGAVHWSHHHVRRDVRHNVRRARETPCSVPGPGRIPCGSFPSLTLAVASSEGSTGLGQVAIRRWPLAQWQPRRLSIDRNLLLSKASTPYSCWEGRGVRCWQPYHSCACTTSWVLNNLGSFLIPWLIISAKVGNILSSALAMPQVDGLRTSMVDDHRDLRDRFIWVNLSLESRVFVLTSSTSPHRLKEPSCTAHTVASWRFSSSLQSATSSDPAWRVKNMPGWNFSCSILLGLGILATNISPPASDSNWGSTTKKKIILFSRP